jgi:predicted nucleic acid-binding protein
LPDGQPVTVTVEPLARGQGAGDTRFEAFIAATALFHNVTLVTHNVQDFSNISGLTTVDWLKP